jgi:hypothetical protein
MSKIFLSFFNGICIQDKQEYRIPAFYESFINGLRNFGNDVFLFYSSAWNKNFGTIPRKLLKEIKDFNPDLIILFNNFFYDISEYFDCDIVIFEVDSPIYYWNKDKIAAKPDRYKFFIVQNDSLEYIIKNFSVLKEKIFKIPFFTEIKAENILQTSNISFVGTFFHYGNFVNKFMLNNPEKYDIRQMQRVFEYVNKFPFVTKKDAVNSLNITSDKVINCLDIEQIVGLLSSMRRVKTLSAVADLGLKLYGTKTWLTEFNFYPEIAFSYDARHIASLQEQQEVYNSSKLSISISHVQAQSGFPWRIFDIMASNSCLVTDYHADFEAYCPNIKIPIFNNHYEAREVCKKLLQEENMRKDIVLSCQEIVNKKFRFKNFLDIIECCLNVKLKTERLGIVRILNEEQFLQSRGMQKKITPIQKLKVKNRIKMFFYLFFLMLGQIVIVDLFFNKKKREKLLGKILKYMR